MRVAVLGGSSPFTAGLIAALAAGTTPTSSVRLYGRDRLMMDALCSLGAALCPHIDFDWSVDLEAACRSQDVIINQIRFGGLEGRADDERLALALGAPPDESIGPAGLHRALCMRDAMIDLGHTIACQAPAARTINLTNPLGLSTSLLHQGGAPCLIGICELPLVTARKVASALECALEDLEWHYTGLNHRGFLHHLTIGGSNILDELARRTAGLDFGGMNGGRLPEFGAVPTKYFSLFSQRRPISAAGRAGRLAELRDRVASDLRAHSDRLPASLAERDQPWWEDAVIPLLEALGSPRSRRLVANLVGRDGLTREGMACVCRARVTPIAAPGLPSGPAAWVARFERHERACLNALEVRNEAAIAEANRLDPLLDAGSSAQCAA